MEIGRYLLHDAIASGGMARVHIGRIVGPAGFSRTVAIKRMHPHLAGDPKFTTMFLDEAKLASRVQHPNVVGTLDVVVQDGELFIVMDLVRGESLAQLLSQGLELGHAPSAPVAVAIVVGVLHGLHAAHEATDEACRPLGIVHRDVSPQNVLVGLDGIARVVDFGIAKAQSRLQQTEEGELKGKLAYMAPEQTRHAEIDRRTDVYAASVVLWELLARRRLFMADSPAAVLAAVIAGDPSPAATYNPEVSPELDAVVRRGLAADPGARFATALDMADALAQVVRPASPREVAVWVERAGGERLERLVGLLADLEQGRVAVDPIAIAGVMSGTERRRIVEAPTGQWAPSAQSARDVTANGLVIAAEKPSHVRAVVGLAVLLCAIAAGGAFAAVRLRARAAAHVELAASPVATTASVVSASAPSDGAAPLPAAPPLPSPMTEASATPRKTRATKASGRHPSKRPAPAAHAPGCDPPFTIDANGIKRFKRWCTLP